MLYTPIKGAKSISDHSLCIENTEREQMFISHAYERPPTVPAGATRKQK